ncbi:MAG: 4-(cytidine 5'-diphospho)-2-C-methyl-D-erythritol kinase, partial [Candidatus Nanopelagicales bacterium]
MPPAGTAMVVSPAKINLHLSVGPVRPDGYHELVTVFQALDLQDEMFVQRADDLSLETDARYIPTGPENLALRAAALLQERFDVRWGAQISLSKNIPVAGGMAGGSTDAAG